MGPRFEVGQTLPDGAVVTSVTFETLADGSTVEEVHDSGGNASMQVIPGPGTPAANQQQIMQRLRDALVNDALYLTGAVEDHDQIQALTRQMTALIRVQLNRYETTRGT